MSGRKILIKEQGDAFTLENLQRVQTIHHFADDHTVAFDAVPQKGRSPHRLNMAVRYNGHDEKLSDIRYDQVYFIVHIIEAVTGYQFREERVNSIQVRFQKTRKRYVPPRRPKKRA